MDRLELIEAIRTHFNVTTITAIHMLEEFENQIREHTRDIVMQCLKRASGG